MKPILFLFCLILIGCSKPDPELYIAVKTDIPGVDYFTMNVNAVCYQSDGMSLICHGRWGSNQVTNIGLFSNKFGELARYGCPFELYVNEDATFPYFELTINRK